MPPKRAAATATGATAPAATKRASTRKAATETKATVTEATVTKTTVAKTTTAKATAPKKTAVKKAAPAKEAAPKKTAAPKRAAAAAPKKPTAASRGRTAKAADESDKENEGGRAKVNGVKRKREAEEEEEQQVDEEVAADAETEEAERAAKRTKAETAAAEPAKKRKAAAPAAKPAPKRVARPLKVINEAPQQVMDIFVFGEGTAGELGLGSVRVDGKKPIDVKRPRLNHNLKDVVQVACGGMHVAALTKDNRILTWGVNDQGALGRDTTWEGGLRDMADESGSEDDDDEDTGMNPRESTPAEIDTSAIPEDTKWVQVVASDSATFALTETGQVYGWGTFRVSCVCFSFFRRTSGSSLSNTLPAE